MKKIIHYVWLGHGEKTEKIKRCIDSWKKYMPDWEIKEWNEENFPMDYCQFFIDAYAAKKWAFASDVVRLYALYTEGGIYMDTDVEVYQSLEPFLNEEGFTGFEDVNYPVTATMGAEAGNPVIKMMLDVYNIREFKTYDVWTDYIKYEETNTCIISNILTALGIDRKRNETQKIKHFTVYPTSYFFTPNERIYMAFFYRFLVTNW